MSGTPASSSSETSSPDSASVGPRGTAGSPATKLALRYTAGATKEEQRRLRRYGAVLAGSYLFLIPTTVLFRRGPIESTLIDRVSQVLTLENLGDIDVRARGRDISLVGSVATSEQRELAIRRARERRGVRVVSATRLVVGPPGSATAATAATTGDAGSSETAPVVANPTAAVGRATQVRAVIAGSSVTVEATVSNDEVKTALLGPVKAIITPDGLVDRVTIDPGDGASNLEANQNVGVFLAALVARNIDDGEFQYDNGALLLKAKVRDAEEQARVRGDAELLVTEPGKLSTDFVIDDATPTPSTPLDGATTTIVIAVDSGATTTTPPTTTTTLVPQITPELISAAEAAIDANLAGKVITFEKESAQLDAGGRAVIDSLAAALKSIPSTDIRFEVKGYTDSRGSDAGNRRLSQRRASAVRERLINRGIAGSRIDALGLGEADPVADNETEEGRAQNRRIEIRPIVPPGLTPA